MTARSVVELVGKVVHGVGSGVEQIRRFVLQLVKQRAALLFCRGEGVGRLILQIAESVGCLILYVSESVGRLVFGIGCPSLRFSTCCDVSSLIAADAACALTFAASTLISAAAFEVCAAMLALVSIVIL